MSLSEPFRIEPEGARFTLSSNLPQPASPRSIQLALFATGVLWLVAARSAAEHAAAALASKLFLITGEPLLRELFFLFLLLAGFTVLHWIATRSGGIRATNALPARSTSQREWALGAAFGWGLLLVSILPIMLTGNLHPQFWWAPRAWGLAVLSLTALAVGSLATEIALRGYVFQRLIAAVGPVFATLLLSLLSAALASLRPNGSALSFAVAFVAAILFSLAYLRTHAVWLGWGLRFGWSAAAAVFFGLPVQGSIDYLGPVAAITSGADWLSGGGFGPEGALFTGVVLLAGMALLYRATRTYAWDYTHPPIIAGGYPVVVAPPAAHVEMEKAAAVAPLVQIAAATSASPSTLREAEEFLRREVPPRPNP